jgi:hypothetical protein
MRRTARPGFDTPGRFFLARPAWSWSGPPNAAARFAVTGQGDALEFVEFERRHFSAIPVIAVRRTVSNALDANVRVVRAFLLARLRPECPSD